MADPSRDRRTPARRTPPTAGHEPIRLVAIGLLAIVLLGALIYLLILTLDAADLVQIVPPAAGAPVHRPRVWVIVALVSAVLTLLGWALTERDRAGLLGRADEVTELRDRLEREAEEHGRELSAERERRRRESVRREQLERGWRSEREWNRELREQLGRLQHTQGLLGRHDDVREMVLALTMQLVEAEKGVLLSTSEDSAGRLQVVAHAGFTHDPVDSALAQRFAHEVIDRDQTLREDRPARSERATPADQEVDNLLAIPIYLRDEFAGAIVCANRDGGFDDLQDEVLLAIGDHAGSVLQNSRLRADLRHAYLSTIGVLADAIELKDRGLRGHSDAVSRFVVAVADQMELPPDHREALVFASLLHDVGKLGISERILLKPGRLTAEERAVIQLHPRIGYELVRQVPALRDIAPAILHHHERYDGEGYPGRLKGEAIPLEARIIAIADTFSAITAKRPYDDARSTEDACAELERCAGGQFDPALVRLFVEQVRGSDGAGRPEPVEPNDELEVQRAAGEYKLGGHSFAMVDSLTLLYSHRHLHETAQAEAQRAELQQRPFAVLIASLGDLDAVNATRGFAAGDALLRTSARLAQQLATENGALSFRDSGRRIGLVVPGADPVRAAALADAFVNRWSAEDPGGALRVGHAVWSPGEDGAEVIARARRVVRDGAGESPGGL